MSRLVTWCATLGLTLSAAIATAQPVPGPPPDGPPLDGAAAPAPDEPPPDGAGAPAPDPAAEPAPDGDVAPPADDASGWGDLSDMKDAAPPPTYRTKLYGFIDFHVEKVAPTPDAVDAAGETVYAHNPIEVDVPNLNVMVQGAIHDKYRYYLNLASPGSGSNVDDEPIVVRNAWVELPLAGARLGLRVGKSYRRFGLYNEILDAVPTFIGIEPPEMFDKDHLLLTRTTSVIASGEVPAAGGVVQYSATTGNDERAGHALPLGLDLRLVRAGLTIGTSFYRSGEAVPSRAVGDGSPRGGVASWMRRDSFLVYGGFVEYVRDRLTVQVEAWQADHDATRDPDALAALAADGGLNQPQLDRFFVGGDPGAAPRLDADYAVRTAYLRAGYEVAVSDKLTVTPYGQLDYYANPETIAAKSLGGDAEAGITDDGRFEKFTLGAVIRPASAVALKIDGSGHLQQFNGASEFYPEIRISLSYLWEYAP